MLSKRAVVAGVVALMLSGMAGAADIVVAQKDKSFQKDGVKIDTLTINRGDTVFFKNEDPFFHNIFSLSDLKTFDLGSYPAGQEKSVTFDEPGEAQIECAIHPQMQLKLIVK